MRYPVRILSVVLAVTPTILSAQTAAPPPIGVLSVFRESVKVGKGAAHDAHEAAWSAALIAAKSPDRFVAMSSLTGPNEIWYLQAYPTWAEYEKQNEMNRTNAALAAVDKQFRGAETEYLTDHFSVWEATSGAPGGTFFTMVARKSLAELDSGATIHGAAYTAALGGEEGQKKLAALNSSAIISQQTDHFAYSPSQSVPPDGWVEANPGFWKRKAPAKKTP